MYAICMKLRNMNASFSYLIESPEDFSYVKKHLTVLLMQASLLNLFLGLVSMSAFITYLSLLYCISSLY